MSFKPIPNLSGTQANFTGNITSAGDLTVEGNITMGGANVLTGISSSDVTGALGFTPISAQTDDQTLDEVLAQGNTSSKNITAGAITGSALTIDTDTLFVDSSNNRVGIGTTSPSSKLDVYQTFSSASAITSRVPYKTNADSQLTQRAGLKIDINEGATSISIGGIGSSNGGFLQAYQTSSSSTDRPFVINPFGGKVGTNYGVNDGPDYDFDVNGTGRFVGNLYVDADLDVTGDITMGGETVLTGISSSDVTDALGFTPISAQTDDQTLDEVLAQGNTSSRHITAGGVTGSNGLRGQDVQIGVTDSALIDTSAGNLDISSAGGTTTLGDTTISITNELGIGTTSPDYNLDIGGDTSSANNTIRMVQANNGTAIRIGAGGGSNDVNLLRVDGGTSVNKGESDSANFGFSLRYKGSGSGANNSLAFFADNSTAGSQIEALTILNDGKVGIGIASPEQELHVYQGTAKFESTDGNDVSLRLGRSDVANLWDFNHAGNDLRIYNSGGSGYDILFGVNSGGTSQSNKVGINTASPSHQLDVNGTFQAVGDATFDANVNAAGVITTGGNTEAEVKSWLHVGRMWSFNGLPGFSADSGAAASRSDGVAPGSLSTGAAASRRAMMTLIRNTYNDYGGYSGAGPDYSRAIGASIKLSFFANGQNSSIVRLLVGSPSSVSSTPYADEDPLSNHGFGVEFRRGSGSTYEWRVFGHNGTSLTASTFTSTGITYTTDPRTIAVYSDGAGNITAYTALYGSTSYTTATTTGGPTTTAGGMSTYTSIQVATNDSSYVSGASAKCVFIGANFYAE